MLTPRPQRPTAYDLVRAVTPPLRDPLPQRSPLPAYDPHNPKLEPRTETMHRPPVKFTPSRLGPGDGDCDICWCPEDDHRAGYDWRVGACKRRGCDTGCEQFKLHRTWRTYLRWAGIAAGVLVAAACTPVAIFLVAAVWQAIP